MESDTIESPEDSELDPSAITGSEVEKRRVFEDYCKESDTIFSEHIFPFLPCSGIFGIAMDQ